MKQDEKVIGQRFNKLLILKRTRLYKNTRNWMVLCLCDCGNEKEIPLGAVKFGSTKSCGCFRKEIALTRKVTKAFKEPGKAGLHICYTNIKWNAKSRDINFELTIDQVKEITSKKCYYCDKEPSQISRSSKSFGYYFHNGIDRIDNNIGYILKNCVPCCKKCNWMKMDLNINEFKELVTKIYKHFIIKK